LSLAALPRRQYAACVSFRAGDFLVVNGLMTTSVSCDQAVPDELADPRSD